MTAVLVIDEAHRLLSDALLDRPQLPCMAGEPLSDDMAARAVVARELCPGCPVLNLCRAAGESETFGTWGGVDRTPGAAARARKKAA